jgi:hypothetical protein
VTCFSQLSLNQLGSEEAGRATSLRLAVPACEGSSGGSQVQPRVAVIEDSAEFDDKAVRVRAGLVCPSHMLFFDVRVKDGLRLADVGGPRDRPS